MTRILLASLAALLPAFGAAEAQLIVQLRPGVDPAAVASRDGVALRGVTPNAPFALFGVTSGTVAAAQARLVADTAAVVWAEDNVEAQNPESAAVRSSTGQSSTVYKGSSLSVVGGHDELIAKNANALTQVDWSATLAASAGRTVRLAILDTGLSRRQAELWAKVDASLDVTGGDADDAPMGIDSNGNGLADEAVGHGTMVAGIVDAVAPKVRLVVAKIADSDGRATAWSIVQGLAFAVNGGAEVANLSMGSPTQVAAFNDVAEWCESKGLLVVAPSGNAGVEGAWYPARSSKALCVVGLDSNEVLASFSNWDGSTASAAPAVGLTSQWWDGGLGVWSGTSFASPFVAAGVADCLRRTGTQRPKDLVKAVKDTGRKIENLNDRQLRGKIGTLLDIVSLDSYLKRR